MTDFTNVGVRSPSLLQMCGESIHALVHHINILMRLKLHERDKGFKVVLQNGAELKISGGYKMAGGLIEFDHHSGPQSISFARIANVQSNE